MSKQQWVRVVLLGIAGGAIFALFLAQKLYVTQSDFLVAHQLPTVLGAVQFEAALFALTVGLLWYALGGIELEKFRRFSVLVGVGTGLCVVVAMLTPPTRSQDIYHSLLLSKGFAQNGFNPYQTTPLQLASDPWARPVQAWLEVPMVYGPLWTLLLAGIASLTSSLGTALVLVKTVLLFALVGAGIVFAKTMALEGVPLRRRRVLMTFFAFNPFLIQQVLVDAHNDVFLLLSLLAGYFFFRKERYVASAAALLLGGFVKYMSWWLLPVPLFYLIKTKRFGALGLFLLASIVSAVLVYAPFGFSLGNFAGLAFDVRQLNTIDFQLAPTALLMRFFSLGTAGTYLVGFLLGSLAAGFLLWARRPLWAFSAPYAALFVFGMPWFQPWYLLWILPLAALALPLAGLTLVEMFFILMPEALAPLALVPVLLMLFGLAAFGYGLVQSLRAFGRTATAR